MNQDSQSFIVDVPNQDWEANKSTANESEDIGKVDDFGRDDDFTSFEEYSDVIIDSDDMEIEFSYEDAFVSTNRELEQEAVTTEPQLADEAFKQEMPANSYQSVVEEQTPLDILDKAPVKPYSPREHVRENSLFTTKHLEAALEQSINLLSVLERQGNNYLNSNSEDVQKKFASYLIKSLYIIKKLKGLDSINNVSICSYELKWLTSLLGKLPDTLFRNDNWDDKLLDILYVFEEVYKTGIFESPTPFQYENETGSNSKLISFELFYRLDCMFKAVPINHSYSELIEWASKFILNMCQDAKNVLTKEDGKSFSSKGLQSIMDICTDYFITSWFDTLFNIEKRVDIRHLAIRSNLWKLLPKSAATIEKCHFGFYSDKSVDGPKISNSVKQPIENLIWQEVEFFSALFPMKSAELEHIKQLLLYKIDILLNNAWIRMHNDFVDKIKKMTKVELNRYLASEESAQSFDVNLILNELRGVLSSSMSFSNIKGISLNKVEELAKDKLTKLIALIHPLSEVDEMIRSLMHD